MGPLDLIIWPEVAYPYGLSLTEDGKKFKKKLPYTLRRYFQLLNKPLLFGGYINNDKTKNKNYQDTYNSALFLDSFGKLSQSYSKRIFCTLWRRNPLHRTISVGTKFFHKHFLFCHWREASSF